jgi:protein kinase-like protein
VRPVDAVIIGARLGPYEILGPIGRGGMGEVYRARDARLGREVAIKVLPAETDDTPDSLARFEREARAVAALNHPNILAIHDIGNASGVVYAVMELLEGETLRDRLQQQRRITPLKAIEYAIQIARGLAAAHERGIVHRDLKPENLFITSEGHVKILDFGLALQAAAAGAADADTRATRFMTEPGLLVGTPGYTSPEQVLGEPATPRTDLFAFGIVVYEMLTGSHPFRRGTAVDTVTAILREDPAPLGPAVPSLAAGITGIIERCLDKHPGDRPASARDLAMFLEAGGTSEVAVGGRAVATSDLRRVRNRILATTCALLILLSMSIWVFGRVTLSLADRAVTAAIEADLTRAERLVRRVQADRLANLEATARLVASFPELKALFGTDAATVRDFLVSYQQRNPGAPLLIALDAQGRTIARTDEATAVADEPSIETLARGREPAVIEMRARPYHAAVAPADAGGQVFGYVAGAMPINESFAATLRDATQDEVMLLSDRGVLASTLRAGQTPWRSREEWRRAGGRPEGSTAVSIGVQRFTAREIVLADQPSLSAVILKSRDEANEPYRRIQQSVVILGLLAAAVAAAGSVWIARTVIAALQRG